MGYLRLEMQHATYSLQERLGSLPAKSDMQRKMAKPCLSNSNIVGFIFLKGFSSQKVKLREIGMVLV